MNRFIFFVLMLTFSLVAPNMSSAVTIQQPQANTIFSPGQKVHVVVNVAPDEELLEMLIKTNRGTSEIVGQPPYETDLLLDKAYLGAEEIAIFSRLRNGNILETRINISVQLPPDVKLEKIVVGKYESIVKAPAGKPLKTRRLQTSGLFSDGVERDLDIVSGLQFTSDNPNVVTVDNKGTLTAVNLGRAKISIVAGDKSETVDVKVYVIIKIDSVLLVKPVDTGIQLDWKLSPQDPEWVTSYMVFRTEDPDGIVKKKIADVPNGTTTYIDTTAEKGKTYYYGVQAMSATANERSSMTNMTPGMLP